MLLVVAVLPSGDDNRHVHHERKPKRAGIARFTEIISTSGMSGTDIEAACEKAGNYSCGWVVPMTLRQVSQRPCNPLIVLAFVVVLACCADGNGARGQMPAAPTGDYGDLLERLDRQEQELRVIREQLDRQNALYGRQVVPPSDGCCSGDEVWRLPVAVDIPPPSPSYETPSAAETTMPKPHVLQHEVVYDKGFRFRPFDKKKIPFELKVNGRIQFRYIGFARDVDSWTDNAGVTRIVRNRNNFDIERARLAFSGYALDPRLTYYMQLDGDTDGRETVDFLDYLWGWKFSERFKIEMGKRKVPASRQWLTSSRDTRLVDRPMANDFFRPDRSTGVFAIGRIGELGHYEVMVGNGYRTANITPAQLDNRFTFAATNYWDPLGDFGKQIVDFDYVEEPLVRFGHSFVYSPQTDDTAGEPRGEADFLRLTDGTQLTSVGALAAGVTVSQFDIYFYGVDMLAKWRGWSVTAEAFFRWIEDIGGDGPIAINNLFQRGFYVEGGRFIVPKKLDLNVRYSQVDGLFGNSSEYAAGFNWYPLETVKMKISFDVTLLDGSPLDNSSSNILVGEDGTLFRTQFQASF